MHRKEQKINPQACTEEEQRPVMLSGSMYERTKIKSLGPSCVDVVIGNKNLEEKRERSVSPLLWKSVSLFDEEESLLPRDLFGAKVR